MSGGSAPGGDVLLEALAALRAAVLLGGPPEGGLWEGVAAPEAAGWWSGAWAPAEGGGGGGWWPGGLAEGGVLDGWEGHAPEGAGGRSDAQNVHDHGVASSLREMCAGWAREAAGGEERAAEECLDWALGCEAMSAGDKGAVLMALDAMGSEPSPACGGALSERALLAAVWRRARGGGGEELVVRQLADCVEGGAVVCSSGRVARVCAALEGTAMGLGVRSRPMWVVRQELLGVAGAVQAAGGSAADFRAAVERDYVQGLGMSPAVLAPLLDELCAGFE